MSLSAETLLEPLSSLGERQTEPEPGRRPDIDAKQGRVEFRLHRTSIVHVPIGKVSFEEDKLLENLATLVQEVVKNKPSGAKGQFIRSMTLTTTKERLAEALERMRKTGF